MNPTLSPTELPRQIKKCKYIKQISRDPLSSVELKEVKSNDGVKIDD